MYLIALPCKHYCSGQKRFFKITLKRGRDSNIIIWIVWLNSKTTWQKTLLFTFLGYLLKLIIYFNIVCHKKQSTDCLKCYLSLNHCSSFTMSGRCSIPTNIWWEIWDILAWFSGPSHSLHLCILTLFSNDEYQSNRCGLSSANLGLGGLKVLVHAFMLWIMGLSNTAPTLKKDFPDIRKICNI